MTDSHSIAIRLREAREFLGASQEFVAAQTSLNRSALSDIERGRRKVSSEELTELAAIYGVSVLELLGQQSSEDDDDTLRALARTAGLLQEEDRAELLRFAQFLKSRNLDQQ